LTRAKWVPCAKDGTCANLSQTVSLGSGPLNTVAVLPLAVPLVFGMFWGGPAVARERETGTMQMAWTQSVTWRHWLSVKVAGLLLAGAVFGGAVAGIVTWWYALHHGSGRSSSSRPVSSWPSMVSPRWYFSVRPDTAPG
jgi:hypothetical protein